MYKSWANMLRQYLITRFPPMVYLPCAVFLVTSGITGGRSISFFRMFFSFLHALTLLLQFRLWDDISDINRDKKEYPDRIMVQAKTLRPFMILAMVLFAANLFLLAGQPGPPQRFGVFLLLNAAYLLWYNLLRGILHDRILGYHMVLAKYPVIVFLLSGDGGKTWTLLLAMAMVFICFALYEALHDRDLNKNCRVIRIRHLEETVFMVISLLMAIQMTGGPTASVLQGVGGVTAFLVLRELFERRGLHLQSPDYCYSVFFLGFLLVVNFSLGV